LLPNGMVLVAGGLDSSFNPSASAELYDTGLGFVRPDWQPQIATATSPLILGSSLVLTGSRFQGISQASSGNFQDSSTNYPVVQLRAIDSSQVAFLPVDPTAGWSNTAFTSTPVNNFPPGPALVTVFTNGIPSDSKYLVVAPPIQVTVKTNPTGLSFTVDGTTYNSTQTFSWVSGSSHTIATTSPQSGGTGVQYTWSKWNDHGAISHTVAPTTNTTYTATFRTQYYLTMTAGTGGRVSPRSGWKNSGAAVSISATPATGYSFSNWTGSGTGSYSGPNNPASITMGGPITETATFIHN
jgi:hypothetical protein